MQKEGKKNDKKDDKTRWELMPLDCLEDYSANLAAQMTEIILGHNIVRK